MSTIEPYIPKNPSVRGILSLLADAENSGDITFDVNGEKIYAHRLILQGCAPALLEYCESCKESNGDIPIKDVKFDIFRHLISYVYGGTIPDDTMKEHAKEFIDASDRFGIGYLKVTAEAWYVKGCNITLDNFIDNFHLSDTKNCALLKEKVMDFIVENEIAVIKRLDDKEAPQSRNMLTDVLTAVARGKRKRKRSGIADFDTMSIDTMRQKLDEKGLDVDGTRKMLLDLVEKNIQLPDEVVVTGAGFSEINGTYVRNGNHVNNGYPKYKKSGHYEGREVEYTIYRMDEGRNKDKWFISLWGGQLDGEEDDMSDEEDYGSDRDFYFSFEDEPGTWQCCEEHGIEPAPTVILSPLSNEK